MLPQKTNQLGKGEQNGWLSTTAKLKAALVAIFGTWLFSQLHLC